MNNSDFQSGIVRGIQHLRERDPVLARLVDQVGAFWLDLEPDIFIALVRSILAQQISTRAARSIFRRLLSAAGGEARLLEALARFEPNDFRAAGVSPQKARYLSDLARNVRHGIVRLDHLSSLSNDQIIAELIQIKGVGIWTAQMLLIFSLGRLDVFPAADLGLRTAIQRLYGKRSLPGERELRRYEKRWQPYASIASWYCWRSLERKPES